MANNPISHQSTSTNVAAVKGENMGQGGTGVLGVSDTGHGVHGDSRTSRGVVGTSTDFQGVFGRSKKDVGVAGESSGAGMSGVFGASLHNSGAGVTGRNDAGGDGVVGIGRRGVVGQSRDFQGVFGSSHDNAGVVGESDLLHGVYGTCHNPNGAGTFGVNDNGGQGVQGFSERGRGVWGHTSSGDGVVGESIHGVGVHGIGGRLAGLFEGNIVVTGEIHLDNGDCAENFDVERDSAAEPGTVMVLSYDGALRQSSEAYDKRVAGVISGAGRFKPGLLLDKRPNDDDRKPVALVGKVYCKVDARYAAIEAGDMLTTSPSPGHAMKVSEPSRAFGAVIGKALRSHTGGKGLIPILVALQ